MRISNETKELALYGGIGFVISLIFGFALFQATGAMIVIGLLILTLPFYIFLTAFSLSQAERIVFSLIMGITIFPSIVYLLGWIISFKLSVGATFLLLTALAIGVKKYVKKI